MYLLKRKQHSHPKKKKNQHLNTQNLIHPPTPQISSENKIKTVFTGSSILKWNPTGSVFILKSHSVPLGLPQRGHSCPVGVRESWAVSILEMLFAISWWPFPSRPWGVSMQCVLELPNSLRQQEFRKSALWALPRSCVIIAEQMNSLHAMRDRVLSQVVRERRKKEQVLWIEGASRKKKPLTSTFQVKGDKYLLQS